jgi:hypothetical protein
LGPRRDAELRIEVLEVFPDRADRKEQRRCDLWIRLASHNKREHLSFSASDSKPTVQRFPDWAHFEALKGMDEVGAERIEQIAFFV